MELLNDFSIKCDRCGENSVNKDSLSVITSDYDRSMGLKLNIISKL